MWEPRYPGPGAGRVLYEQNIHATERHLWPLRTSFSPTLFVLSTFLVSKHPKNWTLVLTSIPRKQAGTRGHLFKEEKDSEGLAVNGMPGIRYLAPETFSNWIFTLFPLLCPFQCPSRLNGFVVQHHVWSSLIFLRWTTSLVTNDSPQLFC